MKRMLSLTVAIIAVCSSVLCAPKDKGEKQAGNVEQTIMRIEKEMLDALLKGDASAHERYLASTYVFTGPDGLVEDKAQSVADLKSGDLKLQSATLDEPKVTVYGDTVVVTYGSDDKGSYKGKDISGKTRWTDVVREAKWSVASCFVAWEPSRAIVATLLQPVLAH